MNTALIFNILQFTKNQEQNELLRIIGLFDNYFQFEKGSRPDVVVRRGLANPFMGRVTEVSYIAEEIVITLVDESGLVLTEVSPDELMPGELSRIINLMSGHVCANSLGISQRVSVDIASRIDWKGMDDEKRKNWREKVVQWTSVFMYRFKDHVWIGEEDYLGHLDRYVTACLNNVKQ